MMALVDGGVYDNMADQWGQGIDRRKGRWPSKTQELEELDELVVVNSSGGLADSSMARLRLPLLGELMALRRDNDVMYDNTTALRRAGLVGRFDRAALQGTGLRGALVHIPQSPFEVPRAFETSTEWPDRAQRARAALVRLAGENEEQWELLAKASRGVKTSLSRLGTDVSANLLRHSYLLAMTNLHVILNYPLVDVPSLEWFKSLASGDASGPT